MTVESEFDDGALLEHRLSSYSNVTDTTESSDENYQETWLESDTMDDLITGTVSLDQLLVDDGIPINQALMSPSHKRLRSKTYSMCSTNSTCSCGSFTAKERCLSDLSACMDYTYVNAPALVVRVTGATTVGGQLLYTIRVEEDTKTWTIQKTYKELYTLYKQVKTVSTSPVETPFWGTLYGLRKCRVPKRLFRLNSRKSITRQRMVIMDSFLRQTAMIVQPTPLGPQRQQVLSLLQAFVGMNSPQKKDGELLRKSSFMQPCTCAFSEKPSPTTISKVMAQAFSSIAAECDEFIDQFTRRASALYIAPSKNILLSKKSSSQETRISKENAQAMLDCIKVKMADLQAALLEVSDVQEFVKSMRLSIADSDIFEEAVQNVRREAASVVQNRVYVALEDDVAECLRAIVRDEDEETLLRKMRVLAKRSQTSFGVKNAFANEDWIHACTELSTMDMCTLPIDKLKCIMNSAMGVYQTVVESHGEAYQSLVLSADDFVPIHVYVVITSLLANPLATKELLALVSDPKDLSGKIGFYYTNFVAAIEHISQLVD
ncbi:unnamed protein product [Aphanomyces euteiches]|uniref:VPS9 domain-containing protein n=1 Tax=Aphanomyces euteiches TaxID=100861 RepID=A0A6G0WLL3_9STRA|nr:hypothetical protein Ae201684_013991 [Aphanomyces euteiches]KAH9082913.1 hypothetical protein Ae201684P_013816 [Aphanomyces euteiches]